MDFYKLTSERASSMSSTERTIANFCAKNLHRIKRMSIRELAAECYVSTTTLFRFVKKLGFSGYGDFMESVRETEMASRQLSIPSIVQDEKYRDSYLKNVIEAVKVITDEKVEQFDNIMSRYPKIYMLGDGLSEEVVRYLARLLVTMGYEVECPRAQYELNSVLKRVKREDVLLVLSYTGNNAQTIYQIQQILSIATPTIISITRADNNAIQNMSDLNFYVFADEIHYNNIDLTSHCGMIAIMETLLYKRITRQQDS